MLTGWSQYDGLSTAQAVFEYFALKYENYSNSLSGTFFFTPLLWQNRAKSWLGNISTAGTSHGVSPTGTINSTCTAGTSNVTSPADDMASTSIADIKDSTSHSDTMACNSHADTISGTGHADTITDTMLIPSDIICADTIAGTTWAHAIIGDSWYCHWYQWC